MFLDIHYVQIHSQTYVSRKAKTTYNLEWREYKQDAGSPSEYK